MTLTTRLSLFFLSALAAVLIGFSAALYVLADRHLHRQLDDRLEAAARTLAGAAEIEPDGVEWEPAGRSFAFGPATFGADVHWAITTDEGRVIDRSSQVDVGQLLIEADQVASTGHRNHVTRIRLAPEMPLPGGIAAEKKYPALILTVAAPLEPVHAALRSLAATLVGLTLVVLVLALIGSRYVCRKALAPVTKMAESAGAMGASDLTERLPVPASRDELAHLGRAFNDLLDRLGEAFARVSQFAGEASHQLRTPLAALIGQVEVALRRERSAEEYQRVLQAVLGQSQRLQRVVEALLFLARSEGEAGLVGFESIDLAQWVRERLLTWNENSRTEDLVFKSEMGESAKASIHPDLFGELFDALIDNALKYSSPGTPVVVRTGSTDREVWVEVEDRGSGVAVEDLPHLFRPFFRADSARTLGIPGAGLGLAVATRIAKAHGGSIAVETVPDQGSRFRVRLPAYQTRRE